MENRSIGIALGAGAARGWAHVGVLQELKNIGIKPEVVCGCSIGALVGGFYAADRLACFQEWLLTLDRLDVVKFLDVSLVHGGLIAGKRIMEFFRNRFGDFEIDVLGKPYGTVATDLTTGQEIWFRSGSLLDAVRASISIPGIFNPFQIRGTWYVDGGIVNPVPVSLCRALGADIVIAVNVNFCHMQNVPEQTQHTSADQTKDEGIKEHRSSAEDIAGRLQDRVVEDFSQAWEKDGKRPGLFQVIYNSILFMQQTITNSRLAAEPAEIVLHPTECEIGLMDFHRAAEAIENGKACVRKNTSALREMIFLA